MKRHIFVLMISALAVAHQSFSQNPFESLGAKDIKVLTFSNGKFNEFFDNDSIVQIGSVLFNTKSNEIVAFVKTDTTYSEATLKPEITSRWLSPDPLAAKYPFMSPYVYVQDNPIIYIDPDGRENLYALSWARQNMVNKGITSDYSNPWYGSKEGGWTFKPNTTPTRVVCYESCWMSYMNSGGNITPLLKETGFATASGGFKGRSSPGAGMDWFKAGDGTDRSFVTDISKGELGDILFMGESRDMEGHAVLLAGLPVAGSYKKDGVSIETMSFDALSTSSTSDPGSYGEKSFTFEKLKNGSWQQKGGGYTFRGFGQLNENKMKGDASLVPKQEAAPATEEKKWY